jgi:hypothetical integral membrane protein (TIGR02206 family)
VFRFQIASLLFVVVVPAIVWWFDRRPHTAHLTRLCERGLAVALILSEGAELTAKYLDGAFTPDNALPMHLCDWALFAVSAALWWRWKAGFDVAYFWGLAGTIQALLTPAIEAHIHWFRLFGFFFIHAGIVAGVLHLVLTARFRPHWPHAIIRVIVASEAYLATALVVNRLSGGNYGFLSHRPSTPTLLDLLSDERWLYVAQINLAAFAFFAALYLPWFIADLTRRTRGGKSGAITNE